MTDEEREQRYQAARQRYQEKKENTVAVRARAVLSDTNSDYSTTTKRNAQYQLARQRYAYKKNNAAVLEAQQYIKDSQKAMADASYPSYHQASGQQMEKVRQSADDLALRTMAVRQNLEQNRDLYDKDYVDSLLKYMDEAAYSLPKVKEAADANEELARNSTEGIYIMKNYAAGTISDSDKARAALEEVQDRHKEERKKNNDTQSKYDRLKESAELASLYNQGQQRQEYDYYSSIPQREDYTEKSGYIADTDYSEQGYIHRIINGEAAPQDYYDSEDYNARNAETWQYMTPEQVAYYNYLYNSGEETGKFLNYIQDELNYKAAEDKYNTKYQGHTAKSILYGIPSGLEQWSAGMSNFLNMTFNNGEASTPSVGQYLSGMVRDGLEDAGPKILGHSIGQVAFDTLSNTANNAPSMLTGMLVPAAGTGLLFTSASGSAYQDAINSGYDADQATGYALLNGASEALLERVLGGINGLSSKWGKKAATTALGRLNIALPVIKNAVARAALNFGGDLASEFTEEYLQEVLDPVFRNWMLGEENDINFLSEDALYAGILGALNAGIMNAPGTISGYKHHEYDYAPSVFDKKTYGDSAKYLDRALYASQGSDETQTGLIRNEMEQLYLYGKNGKTLEEAVSSLGQLNVTEDQALVAYFRGAEDGSKGTRENIFPEKSKEDLKENAEKSGYENEKVDGAINSGIESQTASENVLSQEEENEIDSMVKSERIGLVKAMDENTAARYGVSTVKLSELSEKQKAAVEVVNILAKHTGLNIELYNSRSNNDSIAGFDGIYENGKIYLDVNAGTHNEQAILRAAGHEVTHFIQQYAGESYTQLEEYILSEFYKGDKDSFVRMIQQEIDNSAVAGVELSEAAARDEVIANACEMMLKDSNAITNLVKKNCSLAGRIKAWVERFVAKLKEALAELSGRAWEGVSESESASAELRSLVKNWEEIQKLWDDALEEAVGNYKENGSESSQSKKNEIRYKLKGKENGIEVYETSDEIRKMPYKERRKLLLKSVTEDFRGRTAKFQKNGVTYYALYSEKGVRKGAYGDKKSDNSGRNAKINIGADGNYIELAENAIYRSTSKEHGKVTANRFHNDAKSWDYYRKTVKCDGKYYDVLINVKDTGENQYVYDITMRENKEVAASVALTSSHNREEGTSGWRRSTTDSITNKSENVNDSQKDSGRFHERTEDTLSNRELLASALMGATRTEAERKALQEYQEAVKNIDEFQERYDRIGRTINQIVFNAERDGTFGEYRQQLADLRANREILEKSINHYDKTLLSLEATQPIRNIISREKAKTAKQIREKYNERIREVRAAGADRVIKTRREYQERAKKNVENRRMTETRNKIRKITENLNGRLANPKQNKYVPREFVLSVVEALETLQSDTSGYDRRLQRISEQMASAVNDADYQKLEADYRKWSGYKGGFKNKMNELSHMYESLKSNAVYSDNYDETVAGMVSGLSDRIGGKNIYTMSAEDLEYTYTVMKAVETTIANATRVLSKEVEKNTHEMGEQMIREVNNSHSVIETRLKGLGTIQRGASKWINTSLTPYSFFRRVSGYAKDSAWEEVYNILNEGQRDKLWIEMEADSLFDSLLNGKEKQKELDKMMSYKTEDLVDIGLRDTNGKSVMLPRSMMLSVYMHLLNEANRKHILYGGLTIPDFKLYYKGKTADAFARDQIIVRGTRPELAEIGKLLGREGITEEETNDLMKQYRKEIENGENDLLKIKEDIESKMTKYEWEWISASQKFFDEYSRGKINQVTMSLYGFEKASVDHYFPIHTDNAYLKKESEMIMKDASLENAGFLKKRIKSGKPILLEDITMVINSQIDKVSTYCGMAIPMRDFNKIYTTADNGKSVQKALQKKFGAEGVKYMENLKADIVGARRTSGTFFDRLRGKIAQGTLSLNIRVILGQAASYPTAAAELDWPSLMKALRHGGKKGKVLSAADRELIAKYTPMLWHRNLGNSTQELGDIAQRNAWNKKLPVIMDLIQKMDSATVGRLWYAAQYYVEAHHPDMKRGTDAFYHKTAEYFNRVIERTQPVYNTMQRPDILRNPNAMIKQMVMFKTQTMQNFNIMYDSLGEYHARRADFRDGKNGVTAQDVKAAKVKVINAYTGLTVATITLSLMRLAAGVLLHNMDPYRDEKEDLSMESILAGVGTDMLDTFINTFLFAGDVYEVINAIASKGNYDGISLTAVDALGDVISKCAYTYSAVTDGNWNGQDLEKTWYMVEALGKLYGVPLANVRKMFNGVWYHYEDITNGEFGSFEAGVERTNRQQVLRYYDAFLDGDMKKADRIIKELLEKYISAGKTEDQAHSAMRASFTSYFKPLFLGGTGEERTKIRQMLYQSGLYGTYKEVQGVVDNWLKDEIK